MWYLGLLGGGEMVCCVILNCRVPPLFSGKRDGWILLWVSGWIEIVSGGLPR